MAEALTITGLHALYCVWRITRHDDYVSDTCFPSLALTAATVLLMIAGGYFG